MTDEYTPEMAHAAVERGAAWLDERCPDWISHINLRLLALDSQAKCVLGQTAECLIGKRVQTTRFTRVLEHFQHGPKWAEFHGFDIPMPRYSYGTWTNREYNSELSARYEMLTIAWREYIRQRVETPA